MREPQIIIGGTSGRHNEDPMSVERVRNARPYRDLSTVCVIPTRGWIAARVLESWWEMLTPVNHPFRRMIVQGLEIADAYNVAIERILADPAMSRYRYVLTLEEDNLPPPRGLLELLDSIGDYACVSGLYWSKGENGFPMIFGSPDAEPVAFGQRDAEMAFAPQVPEPDTIQECNGVGMGFTLFDLDVFRDQLIRRPWFQTRQAHVPGVGAVYQTQDLEFFSLIRRLGYRVACNTGVKVGHYDAEADTVW